IGPVPDYGSQAVFHGIDGFGERKKALGSQEFFQQLGSMRAGVVRLLPPYGLEFSGVFFGNAIVYGPVIALSMVFPEENVAGIDHLLHRCRDERPAPVSPFGIDGPDRPQAVNLLEIRLLFQRYGFSGLHYLASFFLNEYGIELIRALLAVGRRFSASAP